MDLVCESEVQYLFKLIKLVGDFYNTTYILAFDDEMVAGALAPLYGDGQKNTGYQFLEKIIQAPLVIPKATKRALVKYAIDLIDDAVKQVKVELTQDDVNRFRAVFDDSFIPAIVNPRLALRYANSLFFSLPLLQGEVSLTDLMLAEALKVFYPQAYDFMRANSGHFLTDNSRERLRINGDSPDKAKIQTDSIFRKGSVPHHQCLAGTFPPV
jgi:predicted KAP-like P-loop ATPase